MKLCAIQVPYGKNLEDTERSVEFLINELNTCDDSLDLILTPEYSNGPGELTPEEALPFYIAHTEKLVEAAVNAAKRCHATVALSGCFKIGEHYRNTTRVYHPDGTIAGDYYKQQLVLREPAEHGVENAHTREWCPPPIIESQGIRLGFLTCYDAYFEEYIAHIAYRRPDIVLVAAFQRGEPCENLRLMNQMLAYHAGAFVLRSSVAMGENSTKGGTSLAVDPAGKLLADFGQNTGKLIVEIADPHWKYCRTNSYGGSMISNCDFIEQGRTPWNYRACGSCVKPDEYQMGYPRVCAHRGFSTVAPENSLPAFGAAIAMGADEIEFDVRFTADGVPVSIHDPSLDRVSNGTGLVEEKTFAELEQLDFGVKCAPQFAGLKILKLEDILKRFPRQAILNIHIKSIGKEPYPKDKFRKILDLLREYDCERHCYIMATGEILQTAREMAPHICRCQSADDGGWEIVDNAIRNQCQKVQLYKPYYNQEMIDKAHAHGILCNMFFSDEPEEARKMLEMGIDTLLTNDYFQIAQVRDRFVKNRK